MILNQSDIQFTYGQTYTAVSKYMLNTYILSFIDIAPSLMTRKALTEGVFYQINDRFCPRVIGDLPIPIFTQI